MLVSYEMAADDTTVGVLAIEEATLSWLEDLG
jgi:hypothetical protein